MQDTMINGRFNYHKMDDQDIAEDPFFEINEELVLRVKSEIGSNEIYFISDIDEQEELWEIPEDMLGDFIPVANIAEQYATDECTMGAIDIVNVKDIGIVVMMQDASPIGIYTSKETLDKLMEKYNRN